MKPTRVLLLAAAAGTMALLSTVGLNGCQKKEDESKPKRQITVENLQVAYGASVKRVRWYDRFVRQAEKEHLTNVALLFRAVKRSEEIHAANHAGLLQSKGVEPKQPEVDSLPPGVTRQALKMAISTESTEFESMYPNLIRTAELENFPEAVEQFKRTRDADARHSELFKDAASHSGNIPRVKYFICSECGYIMTSQQKEECPVCHVRKDRFETL